MATQRALANEARVELRPAPRDHRTGPRNERGRFARALTCYLAGAPGRIRTCDARFRKPTLYPLSYGGPGLKVGNVLFRVYF
jgi:hypothetical protein